MLPSEWKEGGGRKIEEGGRRKEKREGGRDRGGGGEGDGGRDRKRDREREVSERESNVNRRISFQVLSQLSIYSLPSSLLSLSIPHSVTTFLPFASALTFAPASARILTHWIWLLWTACMSGVRPSLSHTSTPSLLHILSVPRTNSTAS